jgi:uncharacterized iron-regulated membrane protein
MTDTVVTELVDPPAEPAPSRAETSRGQWRPLLVRMHFYAGVLVAPFIFLACLTGTIYIFNPQIDRLMEPGLLVVEHPGTTTLPLNQQVANALAAEPGLSLVSVVPNSSPDETTRVNLYRPGGPDMTNLTVFVNPYTGRVQGTKDVSTMGGAMPFSTWMAQFHGDLGLGEFGRWYSELASLWIVVITLGGIVVWWQRCAVHRSITSGTFWRKFGWIDRGKRPGVKRTMSWHSVIGLWTALFAVLFGLTGLPFSRATGADWVAQFGNPHRSSVQLDTKLPGSANGMAAQGSGHNPSGGASGGDMPGMQMPASGKPTGASGSNGSGSSASAGHGGMTMATGISPAQAAAADYDAMVTAANRVGVDQEIRITAPTRPGTGWTVAENKQDWPIAYDSALVAPGSNTVVRTLHWNATATTADKVNRYVMLFHFGRLFGLVGQILFGLSMLLVMWIVWWGYKMWWQRRPRGSAWRTGKAPVRGTWRKAPKVSLAIWSVLTLALFWAFPVLGVSALGFLVLDAALGRIQAARVAKASAAAG